MKQNLRATKIFIFLIQIVFLVVAISGVTAKSSDQAGWLGLLGFILTFIPGFLRRVDKLVLPLSYEMAFFGFIFLSFIGGENFNLYGRFWWWDHALHFISGVMVGYIAMLMLHVHEVKHRIQIGPWFASIFTFSLVVAGAGTWEMFEFAVDHLAHGHMQYGLLDTMNDIINGTLGGLFFVLATFWYCKRRPKHGVFVNAFSHFVKLNSWVKQGR